MHIRNLTQDTGDQEELPGIYLFLIILKKCFLLNFYVDLCSPNQIKDKRLLTTVAADSFVIVRLRIRIKTAWRCIVVMEAYWAVGPRIVCALPKNGCYTIGILEAGCLAIVSSWIQYEVFPEVTFRI